MRRHLLVSIHRFTLNYGAPSHQNRNETATDVGLSLFVTCFGIGKPAAAERAFRDTRQVWLNVEKRRAVEHIDTAYPQPRALPPEQLDDSEGDGIRPTRRPRREHTVRTAVITWRARDQIEIGGSIEGPDNKEVGESFDIS